MFSASTIAQFQEEAAARAKAARKEPFVFFQPEDVNEDSVRHIPNLGTYIAPGWEALEEEVWFVDKSGFGADYEPALTIPRFVEQLKQYVEEHDGDGFGIVEEGPFQIYIQAFRKK